ncbi:MAG: STAS domain-containing protein [Anaerolineae bacterium]|nr:STAS domain-containing protein [Anaerolineae bacterium]
MLTDSIPIDPKRIQLFEIIGRIDTNSAMQMTHTIQKAIMSGRTQLVLDMNNVEYINSAGLRELVQIFKRVQQAGGILILVNPSEYVRKPLELVGLDSVFTIYMDPLWDASRLTTPSLPAVPRQMCYYA